MGERNHRTLGNIYQYCTVQDSKLLNIYCNNIFALPCKLNGSQQTMLTFSVFTSETTKDSILLKEDNYSHFCLLLKTTFKIKENKDNTFSLLQNKHVITTYQHDDKFSASAAVDSNKSGQVWAVTQQSQPLRHHN
jgi:hypothetical protein